MTHDGSKYSSNVTRAYEEEEANHHNIFAWDSNAALLLLFSAARRAARLAAPDPLSARLLSHTLYATRATAPTPTATYTRLIQPCSFANSSASASAIVEPSRVLFFFRRELDVLARFSAVFEEEDRVDEAAPSASPAASAPSKHHAETSDEDSDTTSYPAATHICVPRSSARPSSPIQSESFAQIVSLARHGTTRPSASSAKCSSAHARKTESQTRAHTGVFAATPARGSHTEHSSDVQACAGE